MTNSHRTLQEKITKLIEPVVESEKMELVGVECMGGRSRMVVRIYIDKEGGVTVDDCAEISNQVGDILDIYDAVNGSYDLEVSSPGIDRPLIRDKDFIKYKGYKIRVRLSEALDGRKNFCGTLTDFIEKEEEKILIIDMEGKIYNVPTGILVKANLQYEF
jgi:ribosome maturation factor RimP